MSKSTFNYAQAAKKASSSAADSAAPSPTSGSPAPQQAPTATQPSTGSSSASAPQTGPAKDAVAPSVNGKPAPPTGASKPAEDSSSKPVNASASTSASTPAATAHTKPNIPFNSFFRGKPSPSPAPQTKPAASAAPTTTTTSTAVPPPPQTMRRSASTYDPNSSSPHSQHQSLPHPPPPSFQMPPASGPSPAARAFTPGMSTSFAPNGHAAPAFVPGQNNFKPGAPPTSAGPYQPNFTPAAQRPQGPPQGQARQGGPQQPPQQGFYPQPQFNPQQSGQWNQQQQGQGQGYYQPNFYYPGQFPQQGQHIPPAASQNLGRSGSQSGPHPPSNLPGAAPPANGARPGTPGSQVGSPPPNSSPYRNFNPGASEFSPNPNAFFQPRAESKGIRISKPPATTPSKAIPIKAPPSKASEGSAPSNADKDDAAAASKQQEESDKKASKEKDAAEDEAAKLKTAQEAEAKAKEDAEAKAKAEAEEADRKRKLEEEQQRKAQEEAEKARKDKEEADKKAQQEQEAAAAEKKKAEQEEAEKAAREAAAAQEAKQAAAQEAKQATAEVTPEPASATKPAEETSKTPQTPAEVTASTNESLKTAKAIENLKDVQYPESVSSSRAELNENATPGQYFYEREFLLQFMNVCRERPDALPSLEAIGMADADGSVYTPAGGHSAGSGGMSRQTSYGGRGRAGGSSSRQSSMSGQPRSGNYPPPMGAFNSAPAKTSQERFAQSMQNTGFGSGGSFGRPGPGGRQNSMLGGMGMGNIAGSNRRSERGSKRGNPRGAAHQPQETFDSLTRNQNAWTPDIQSKAAAAAGPSDPLAPELVQRKVKALLNKLTVDNFDSISTQLLEWANKSEQEQDGRILRQVIALIFEKATDEAAWSEMYARLARKLQDCISQNVTDVTMTSKEAVAPAGGSLFRKYLLNRCQEDYEKGWSERQRTASAAAASADADKAKLESNEAAKAEAEKAGESGAKKDEPQEAEILSDEYYAAQKAKRRGLGLVRFIGELYKLNMLTGRIMHECIKKLLADIENPEEDDMESLCRLLTTVGKQLEEEVMPNKQQLEKSQAQAKAKAVMDIYMDRLGQISHNDRVSSRIRFMVQDVLDLRRAGWKGRQAPSGPKTIQQIHADAQQAQAEASRKVSSSNRLPPMSQQLPRGGSRGGRGRETGADGWSSVPQQVQRTAGSAGDMSQFGRIRSQQGGSRFGGPSSAFNRNRSQQKEEAPAQTARSNPFAALENDDAAVESGEGEGRRPLKVLPRTKPVEGQGEPKEQGMSDEAIQRSINNSIKEYLTIKDVKEGQESFNALPSDARWRLIKQLAGTVIKDKQPAVEAAVELFKAVQSNATVTKDDFVRAYNEDIEELLEISYDAPYAVRFYGQLLKASSLSKEDVEAISKNIKGEEPEEAEDVREQLMSVFSA